MNPSESLYNLLAPIYFDRAVKAATAQRWVEAEADLARFMALLPHDYRAPLLLAKIRLHEGRLAEGLTALEEAGRLGHEPSENYRMIAWLVENDRHRHVRALERKQIKEQFRPILPAIRRCVYFLCSRTRCKRRFKSAARGGRLMVGPKV